MKCSKKAVDMTAWLDRELGSVVIRFVEKAQEMGMDPEDLAKSLHTALGIHLGRAFLIAEDFIETRTGSEAEAFNRYMHAAFAAARVTVDRCREDGFPLGG